MKKIISIILAAMMLLTFTAYATDSNCADFSDADTGLIAPWYIYQAEVKALFDRDPQIDVGAVYQQENGKDYAFDIEVRSHAKYMALDRVLSRFKLFGNVALTINLFDEENDAGDEAVSIYSAIFDGNPIVESVEDIVDPAGVHHGYVVFRPEIIQFYADDLRDINGNWSGLAQDIAREIFDDAAHGLNFCTGTVAVG
ncbi:MAG: hypothetical protein IKN05_03295 [Clostridia bacterium]|nr:hypothetical protein [Clostridia bacterium]